MSTITPFLNKNKWFVYFFIISIITASFIIEKLPTSLLNGDGILPVFNSFQKWQLFYWGQSRFAQIVPFFCQWIKSPFANLLVQFSIQGLMGFFSLSFISYYFFPERWFSISLLSVDVFLMASDHAIFFYLATNCVYGSALFFGFLGLLFFTKNIYYQLFSLVFIIAATLITPTVIMPLIFCFFIKNIINQPLKKVLTERKTYVFVLLLFLSVVISKLAMDSTSYSTKGYFVFDFSHFGHNFSTLLCRVKEQNLNDNAIPYFIVFLIGLIISIFTRNKITLIISLSLIAYFILEVMLFSQTLWVKKNQFDSRYVYAGCICLIVGIAILLDQSLLLFANRRKLFILSAFVLAFGLLRFNYFRSTCDFSSRLRSRLNDQLAYKIIDHKCDLIDGSYWVAWRTVLMVNQLYYENNINRKAYSLAHKFGPMANEINEKLNQENRVIHIKREEEYVDRIMGKKTEKLSETDDFVFYKLKRRP